MYIASHKPLQERCIKWDWAEAQAGCWHMQECYHRADTGILLLLYFVRYCSDSSGTAMIVILLKSDWTMIIRLPKSDRLWIQENSFYQKDHLRDVRSYYSGCHLYLNI